jgi:hypothetical protein
VGLPAFVGCSEGPEVVPVTGTVTRNGKPVPGVMINFMPEDGRPSWAITDAEGRYELQYSKSYTGGLVGKHKVFVGYDANPDGSAPALNEEQQEIVKKYGNRTTSPLDIEIQEKGQIIDIRLD